MTNKIFSVSQINSIIKSILSENFADINVQGEISNLTKASSGHVYFNLKDESGLLACVMFKGIAWKVNQELKDGLDIIVRTDLTTYPMQSKYQAIVKSVIVKQEGNLFLQFQQLKEKLKNQGYFDEDRKKQLPNFISSIAIITSTKGAVIKDMLYVLKKESPFINVSITDVVVQGDKAGKNIALQIDNINAGSEKPDVILLARGGGSIEDLWCFNDEALADAIYHSQIPIISCVGHETDFTISDFTADLRAPTPTAGAQIIAQIVLEQMQNLYDLENRLINATKIFYINTKNKFVNLVKNSVLAKPENMFLNTTMKLDFLTDKLKTLNPKNILNKGYSIAYNSAGKVIYSTEDVNDNEKIKIRTNKDAILAIVEKGESNDKK